MGTKVAIFCHSATDVVPKLDPEGQKLNQRALFRRYLSHFGVIALFYR
jgi:hypothetical protein